MKNHIGLLLLLGGLILEEIDIDEDEIDGTDTEILQRPLGRFHAEPGLIGQIKEDVKHTIFLWLWHADSETRQYGNAN